MDLGQISGMAVRPGMRWRRRLLPSQRDLRCLGDKPIQIKWKWDRELEVGFVGEIALRLIAFQDVVVVVSAEIFQWSL